MNLEIRRVSAGLNLRGAIDFLESLFDRNSTTVGPFAAEPVDVPSDIAHSIERMSQ